MNYTLRWLLNPASWMRLHSTCEDLTNFIIEELDNGAVPVITSDYSLELSGLKLWSGNYPYSYGTLYMSGNKLPSRYAVERLREAELKVRPFHSQEFLAIKSARETQG